MKLLLSICILLLTLLLASPNAKEDAIVGEWTVQDKGSRILIYKAVNNKYYGKIVWLATPLTAEGKTKVDHLNPDVKRHTTPLMNLVVIRDLVFDTDQWNGGTIYSPKEGKEYRLRVILEPDGTLSARGYIGTPLLGKSQVWTRYK